MYQDYLQVAKDAALKAGELLKKGFGTDFKISSKDTLNNLVTEYDHSAEHLIIQTIKKAYPDHIFLAEESGATGENKSGKVRWVIDPIDGTVNFARRIPIFCVSIAAEKDGELLCGVIFNPITEELFYASKGEGAFFNDTKISVSEIKDTNTSLLVTGFPYDVENNPYNTIELFIHVISKGIPIRRLGSAALDLAYVAKGSFEGFWEVGLKPWDVAAGVIIVEEAGGKVTQFYDESYSIFDNTILATNSLVHDDLMELLKAKK